MIRPVVTLLVVVALGAATGVSFAEGETVRVYTNADLLKFGPPPESPSAPSQRHPDEESWKFVTDFIERQRARIESERRGELERRLVDARVDELERRDERLGVALPHYYGFGYAYGHGRGGYRGGKFANPGHGVSGHLSFGSRAGAAALFRPIVPLHARRPLPHGRPSGGGHPGRPHGGKR
jgi:hypothetical protein